MADTPDTPDTTGTTGTNEAAGANPTPATEAPKPSAPIVLLSSNRRSGKDRRDRGQQTGGDERRSGIERRSRARGALWAAMQRSEDAQHLLSSRLVPLLALMETAAQSVHALGELSLKTSNDEALLAQLNALAPGWQSTADDESVMLRLGQCAALARDLCSEAEGTLAGLSHDASLEMQAIDQSTD